MPVRRPLVSSARTIARPARRGAVLAPILAPILVAILAAATPSAAFAQSDRVIVGAPQPRAVTPKATAKPSTAPAPTPELSLEQRTRAVERVFLERAAISEADRRCNLFGEGERIALRSGLSQVRNELLRADYTRVRIDAAEAEARAHAASLPCTHALIVDTSKMVRDAYKAFAGSVYMEYAGVNGHWAASRSIHDRWAVFTADPATGARLGLLRGPDESVLRLAAALPAETSAQPTSARLLMRDPAALEDPWLGPLFARSPTLTAPPRSASHVAWAGEFRTDTGPGREVWRLMLFSDETVARLAALDPREAVVLEISTSSRADGPSETRILFEAGDFAAASDFVAIPAPTYPANAASD
ncbi:hypothetical protein GC169_04730 [bacterium]|nr:hypothetical protein [bacterium]